MKNTHNRPARRPLHGWVFGGLISLLTCFPIAADAAEANVYYTVADADGQLSVSDNTVAATVLTSSAVTIGKPNTDTYYYISSSKTITERLTVAGHVTLILADGATLTCSAGITVASTVSLTITTGGTTALFDGSGALTAYTKTTGNAGIGGKLGGASGAITINGGTVSACSSSEGTGYGAGIGGGGIGENAAAGAGGTIIIRGGTVEACSSMSGTGCGAGIGGGGGSGFASSKLGGQGGTILISGGQVNAFSSRSTTATAIGYGAGIGGGFYAGAGTITISGGRVTACSANAGEGHGTGIGTGACKGTAKSQAVNSGTVAVSGGTVEAHCSFTGTPHAAGIGNGENVTMPQITISGGTTTALGAQAFAATIATASVAHSSTGIAQVHIYYGASAADAAHYCGTPSSSTEENLLAFPVASGDDTGASQSLAACTYGRVSIVEAVSLSMGTTGRATMYHSARHLVVPQSVERAATYVADNGSARAARIFLPGDTIPAGLAVVVRGAATSAATTHLFLVSDTCRERADAIDNQLLGFDEAGHTTMGPDGTTADYVFYKLGIVGGQLGFYYGTSGGGAFAMQRAHTAYLAVKQSAGANAARFLPITDDDTTTGIVLAPTPSDAPAASTADHIFTLDGRRLSPSSTLPRGLYIRNGRKILVP